MTDTNPQQQPRTVTTYTQTVEVNGWKVVAIWRDSTGGPTELHITPSDTTDPNTTAGITTGTLRAIPLTTMGREAAQAWEATANIRAAGDTTATLVQAVKDAIQAQPRPGRAGRPDAFYAAVAFLYITFGLQGHKAIQRLAEACDVEPRTAENWVSHARDKRGLLTASQPGKAAGRLTDKAVALLTETSEEEN